jgi:hypothetical protein
LVPDQALLDKTDDMIRRNRRGRFAKQREASRWEKIICLSILGGIAAGIGWDILMSRESHYVYAKEETMEVEAPREVQIAVHIEWTEERILTEIRNTFPEDSDTAIKIARCESGLVKDIQSHHVANNVRESSWGIFQIHSPSWHKVALRLGYEDYRSDPADNIAMARYIYDNAGKRWTDWSCYTKRMI